MNKLSLRALIFGLITAVSGSNLLSASDLNHFEQCIQASKTELKKYFCHASIARRYALHVHSQQLERHLNIWCPTLVKETRETLNAIKSYEERPNDENRKLLKKLEKEASYGHRLVTGRLAETAAKSPTLLEAKLRFFVRTQVEAARAFDLCKEESDDHSNCFKAQGAYLDAGEQTEDYKRDILGTKILTEQDLRTLSDRLWQEEFSRK